MGPKYIYVGQIFLHGSEKNLWVKIFFKIFSFFYKNIWNYSLITYILKCRHWLLTKHINYAESYEVFMFSIRTFFIRTPALFLNNITLKCQHWLLTKHFDHAEYFGELIPFIRTLLELYFITSCRSSFARRIRVSLTPETVVTMHVFISK